MDPTAQTDPFPASDFDQWAAQYDHDVTQPGFPFLGYSEVLAKTFQLAEAKPGMKVLDLGTGTGGLAQFFLSAGCEMWCSDFSSQMLDLARLKLPAAHLFLHDLRQPFPSGLPRFDRIVSAYVFHHFELPEKLTLLQRLWSTMLAPHGRLVIADISFPTRQALGDFRLAAGAQWEDEPYWIANEALPALQVISDRADYLQVSDCAGIYTI